jgi:hypothetical protein
MLNMRRLLKTCRYQAEQVLGALQSRRAEKENKRNRLLLNTSITGGQ